MTAVPTPTKRTEAVVAEVLERLSAGEPLAVILRSDRERLPTPKVWREWVSEDGGLALLYDAAREDGQDVIAAECLDILDSEPARLITDAGPRVDPGDVQHRRLRVEGRLKLLAKWNPKRWGEKVDITSDGEKLSSIADAIAEGNRRIEESRK